MFRRPHHRRIQYVLESLDANLLAEHSCWFGGGTAIALANREYRESADIDFLVSDYDRYRGLREIIRTGGLGCLAVRHLELAKNVKVDRYGIRTAILVEDAVIKFEIVHEGRIVLDEPDSEEVICGIRTLARVDQVASKLLANDDRWADPSVFNRDLIDLAMMRPELNVAHAGLIKAEAAYGRTIRRALDKAVNTLRTNPKQLADAVRALQIDLPIAAVWNEINSLQRMIAAIPPTAGAQL